MVLKAASTIEFPVFKGAKLTDLDAWRGVKN
jgi:hypothetical protein